MKRKVIQIADSTQLVSLPREWAKKHNIKKGQELDVIMDGDKVIIRSYSEPEEVKAELNISRLDGMAARSILALYKRGVDELKVTFSKPEMLKSIQDALSTDVVGFEILEQGPNHCLIKSVSGSTEEFDPVLRRTFLLLLQMSDEFLNSLKKEDYSHLNNVAFLEQANNRFTTVLRRHMNKNGKISYIKVGPLYYLVENLENLADQFKYSCQYLSQNKAAKTKIRKEFIECVAKTNLMLREFYELFYKFDDEKAARIKATRNSVLTTIFGLLKKDVNDCEAIVAFHCMTLAHEIFCMTGPYLVLSL